MGHTYKDIIEVELMLTHTITTHILAQAIQMVMGITRVTIHHHITIHQPGIHQVIMTTIMIMDTRMTMDMITKK